MPTRVPSQTPGRSGLPRRVFWVRRLVVLGVPLLLVVLLVWWLAGRGSSAPAADASPTVGPTTSPTVSTGSSQPSTRSDEDAALAELAEAAAASDVVVCDADSLSVEAAATQGAFAAGEKPKLTVTVTNRGDEACLVDAGDRFRTVVITSGDDRVWASTDCLGDDPSRRPLLLGPGDSSKETYTWPRVRSAAGCPAGQKAPGNGTYSAQVAVVGVAAAPAVFDLR